MKRQEGWKGQLRALAIHPLLLSRPGPPGDRVLGDSGGTLGHNVLSQLPESSMHTGGQGRCWAGRWSLQPAAHDAHGLGSDAGVPLPQHLVGTTRCVHFFGPTQCYSREGRRQWLKGGQEKQHEHQAEPWLRRREKG